MRRRDPAPSQDEAEALALMALTFLAEEPMRLGRFLSLTGISPEELREAADAPPTLVAILDHLMGDESLLLMFAAEKGIAAETLSGGACRSPGQRRAARFMTNELRIGIDLGGTKIEGIVLDQTGAERARCAHSRRRKATIRPRYSALTEIVARLEADASGTASVGIGMPGSLSPTTGLARNANSTWLNGRPLERDVSEALGRPVRFANDANCFALSEAVDGAGRDAHSVFGIILGTGCGGGIVIQKRLIEGARGIGGEWGHNPRPGLASKRTRAALLVRAPRAASRPGSRDQDLPPITSGSMACAFRRKLSRISPRTATWPHRRRSPATRTGSLEHLRM